MLDYIPPFLFSFPFIVCLSFTPLKPPLHTHTHTCAPRHHRSLYSLSLAALLRFSFRSSGIAPESRSVPHRTPINGTRPMLLEPLTPAHAPPVNHPPLYPAHAVRWTCFIKPANIVRPCPRPAPRQPGKWSAPAGGDLHTENAACWLTPVTREGVDRCRSNKRSTLVPTRPVRRNSF